MIQASFYIAIQLLGILRDKIEKANTRARRARRPGFVVSIDHNDHQDIEGEIIAQTDEGPVYQKIRQVKVTISGDATPIEGWEVEGVIDLSLAKIITFGDVPEKFRKVAGNCDHCGYKRNRKKTVILRNAETGEHKQVGATCLTAFLPGADVEAVASWLGSIKTIGGIASALAQPEPRDRSMSSNWDGYCTEAVLAHSFAAVREHGYRKVDTPGATRDRVLRTMYPTKWDMKEAALDPHYFSYPTEGDWNAAQAFPAWLQTVPANKRAHGYLANLEACVTSEYVLGKHLGILCSAPQAQKTDEERKANYARKAKTETNEHLGVVGDRIEGSFRVLFVTYRPTQWGKTTIAKLADEEGRKAVWFASNDPDLEKGDKIDLKGTIKKLGEWKGTKETVLTRCRFSHVSKTPRE